MTLFDTDTAKPLVSFALDDLRDLEFKAFNAEGGREMMALLYSADGEEWLIQDLEGSIEGGRVTELSLTEDQLVMLTITWRACSRHVSRCVWPLSLSHNYLRHPFSA